jgi:hypothetical protein
VLVILVLSTIHIVSMIGNLVSQRDIILRDGGVVSDRNVTAKSRGKLATYFIIHSKQPTHAHFLRYRRQSKNQPNVDLQRKRKPIRQYYDSSFNQSIDH